MSSTRKSRIGNKRFSKVKEDSLDKYGGNASKSRQRKRKLSDMLGSQWSKEELERFYEAYRKHGKDWKKVSNVIRNRSIDMVEALYNMNTAYLSLPEGTASVAGLIAMMTDHYNILEGSDSEPESNDGLGVSRKPQRRGQGKSQLNNSKGLDGYFPDLLRFQSAPSSDGCLPLLKRRRSGGSRPRAVGKRTPRFPVSYPYDKADRDKIVSLNKKGKKSEVDADDDEVAHVVALALAEGLQRGGSPQVSHTQSKKTKNTRPSPVQSGQMKHAGSELAGMKVICNTIEDRCEGSLGSREAENGDFSRDTSYPLDAEGAGTVEIRRKVKKFQAKKSKVQEIENNHFDDVQDEVKMEGRDGKMEHSSPHGPRKRSRQLFFGDESSALDALQTLADLSLNILGPNSVVDSESSAQENEEKKIFDIAEKPNGPDFMSASSQRDKPKIPAHKDKVRPSMDGVGILSLKSTELGKDLSLNVPDISEAKQRSFQSTSKMQKRKRKSLATKIPKADFHGDSHLRESQKNEVSAEEDRGSMSKEKCFNQILQLSEQGKPVRPPERSFSADLGRRGNDLAESTVEASTINQINLPTKLRSRRKMDLQKALDWKELRPSENLGNERPNRYSHSIHDREVDLKSKLSHCLSSQMLRRWCAFEWFYSAIDHPWFAKREFVEYLEHAGLGHVPRLTRVEWGVIRGSLGKPRRLSKQFLREEREKLEKYRENVRAHYAELRTGAREGLATDLPRPLSVGQRVIAIHPSTRDLHDGSVLTVDRNNCRVQFDRTELQSEIVMDTECMPVNPLENMSEALRRKNVSVDKFHENLNDPKLHSLPKDRKIDGSMKFFSSENLENGDGPSHLALSNYPMITAMKQAKGDTVDSVVQAKAALNEIISSQAANGHPCTLAQIQAKEADIRALSEVTRALDRKEALLIEMKNLNDEEVLGNLKDGDLEHFRKYCATVVVQLKEASELVGSALLGLRQRNTYQGNSLPPSVSRPLGSLGGSVGPPSPFDSGSQVVEIVDRSRRRARTMVDAAMQAMSLLKEGEDAFVRIGEALDSKNTQYFGADSAVPVMRSHTSPKPGHGISAYQDQTTSCTTEPTIAVHSSSPKMSNSSDGTEEQLPSELISSCVATLLMIQTCTERQYPPDEVVQILDSAVTKLQPCCSQNLQIYREIQLCMGIVKNQILARIPTQSNILTNGALHTVK
ncbi:protein ALWAYS EARLY 3-like [Tasmannia lanceolata]|uniref:protein ALWAYS EARLY 3-like n=1 Tax=Tasmannia lanceolata TaxID=3420 RepID=UPI004064C2A0